MVIKLKDLQAMKRAFVKILGKEIPVKLAYRINKLTGKIVAEYSHIDEIQNQLVKKYGLPVKDKTGKDTQQLQVPPEKVDEYIKEFESLLDIEIDIGGDKIPFECLEAMGVISPADLAIIGVFVEAPITPEMPKLNK